MSAREMHRELAKLEDSWVREYAALQKHYDIAEVLDARIALREAGANQRREDLEMRIDEGEVRCYQLERKIDALKARIATPESAA